MASGFGLQSFAGRGGVCVLRKLSYDGRFLVLNLVNFPLAELIVLPWLDDGDGDTPFWCWCCCAYRSLSREEKYWKERKKEVSV